ncbi:MAG: prephenate dehydratase [Candidatus Omnitrophota bacterium]
MKKLTELRNKIDKVDAEIIELLNQRAQITLGIGKIKTKAKKPIFAPKREYEIYEKLSKENKGPLTDDTLKAVYREIMSGSLALEKPLKIAYLGPESTFTHIAALKKFGASVEYVKASTIPEVFTEVEKGRADYGVVPIENSTEGAVTHTLDMFMDSDLKICSEVVLPIVHNLMGKGKIDKVKKVYSNPMVIAQCRNWLEKNLPNVEIVPVASTTRAAQLALSSKEAAAIASELASETYSLDILAKSIEDLARNYTRFLVVAEKEAEPTGHDKTSVLFSMKDRPGALHDVLVPFKKRCVSLTKIESRPSKKKVWKYYFFVDMQGHIKDKKIKAALDELGKNCNFVKFLGSYPEA